MSHPRFPCLKFDFVFFATGLAMCCFPTTLGEQLGRGLECGIFYRPCEQVLTQESRNRSRSSCFRWNRVLEANRQPCILRISTYIKQESSWKINWHESAIPLGLDVRICLAYRNLLPYYTLLEKATLPSRQKVRLRPRNGKVVL